MNSNNEVTMAEKQLNLGGQDNFNNSRQAMAPRKNFAVGMSVVKDGSPQAKSNMALIKRLSVNAANVR